MVAQQNQAPLDRSYETFVPQPLQQHDGGGVAQPVQNRANPFAVPPSYVALMMGEYFIQMYGDKTAAIDQNPGPAVRETLQFAKRVGEYGA